MAQAKVAAAESRRRRGMLWSSPLVAGLCFGLAYGVTHRLSNLNVGDWGRSGTGFDVQPFPGTSLESLTLRFGAPEAEIRGDLERQELERQQAAQDQGDPTLDVEQKNLPTPSNRCSAHNTPVLVDKEGALAATSETCRNQNLGRFHKAAGLNPLHPTIGQFAGNNFGNHPGACVLVAR